MPNNIPKYRPSFSAAEIIELHHALLSLPKELIREEDIHKKLLTKITTLTFKLDIGVAQASYNMSPKIPLIEQLGGIKEQFPDPMLTKTANYTKYTNTPNECSREEVLDALEYKEYGLKEELTEEERAIIDESWEMTL